LVGLGFVSSFQTIGSKEKEKERNLMAKEKPSSFFFLSSQSKIFFEATSQQKSSLLQEGIG
jgi:hypothetical protein